MDMTLHSRLDHGGVVILTVSGEVDRVGADRLHSTVHDLLSLHRPIEIRVDLSRVTFLSSTGAAAFGTCRVAAAVAGTRFTLRDSSPYIRRQAATFGIRDLLE
jgi:anti-anti-sigma factor